ncbi:MAG TPA: S8 family serine peptidase [Telluria sp.]
MKNFPRELINGNGVPMTLDPSRLLLAFKSTPDRAVLDPLLAQFDLMLETMIERPVPGEEINNTSTRFWVQARRAITDDQFTKLEATLLPLGLDFLGPVYSLAGERGRRALLSPLPSTVVVRLRQRGEGLADMPAALIAAAADGDPQPQLEEHPEKSRFLNGLRYFTIANAREVNAFMVKRLLESMPLVSDVQFESMPMVKPTCIAPSDSLFAQQWDMVRIEAGGAGTTAWDLSTGASVVVCVLDEGVDLGHPDLQFSGQGINLGSMSGTGAPTGNHGTACAGIVAASFNNGLGVAGVAGSALIQPVAFQNWTDVEVAAGINWATANGAQVISMSFGWNAWSHAIIDPAIAAAHAANVVQCVATHNHNGAITYPATNPLVMAIGASDEIDNRKSPSSPDGEGWGSNFGPAISVVAPGVHIPTTDRRGADGYNTTPGTGGDFMLTFNGTSSATPHVAGQAALIRSFYPTLSNDQVRSLIERTAQKVGTVAYAETAGYPSGSWNQEMGYGRINVLRALDAADVIIRDAPSDNGAEPFTGGNFWDFSDIVVRITDDNVFVPSDPLRSKNVERGQANYIYVRVTNNGPRPARNVNVSTRITPFVGLQFVYPQDWTLTDANHVNPAGIATNFGTVAPGASVIAKFRISAAQVESLYGWVAGHGWHPCLLAQVTADNDYAFTTAVLTGDPISARRNNLAQRNLSVIDVLGSAPVVFPWVVGNRFNFETSMGLTIDRSRLPANMPLLLSIDDDGSEFPLVDFDDVGTPGRDDDGDGMDDDHPRPGHGHGHQHPHPHRPKHDHGHWHQERDDQCDNSLVFLHRTKVKTRLGCCMGVLTIEKGSRFDCPPKRQLGEITVIGGDVVLRGGRRFVEIRNSVVRLQMEKTPGAMFPMSLHTTIPAGLESGEQLMVQLSQQNARGTTAGGAAVIWVVR